MKKYLMDTNYTNALNTTIQGTLFRQFKSN